jgi:hypothetical protein
MATLRHQSERRLLNWRLVVWFKSGSRSMRSLGWLSSSMANDFKGRSQ